MQAIAPDRFGRRARQLARRFRRDRSGATAIEYGLIAMICSITIITGAQLIGTQTGSLFGSVADKVAAALSP
jgi:pilus assembly protein Flp/PilA